MKHYTHVISARADYKYNVITTGRCINLISRHRDIMEHVRDRCSMFITYNIQHDSNTLQSANKPQWIHTPDQTMHSRQH